MAATKINITRSEGLLPRAGKHTTLQMRRLQAADEMATSSR